MIGAYCTWKFFTNLRRRYSSRAPAAGSLSGPSRRRAPAGTEPDQPLRATARRLRRPCPRGSAAGAHRRSPDEAVRPMAGWRRWAASALLMAKAKKAAVAAAEVMNASPQARISPVLNSRNAPTTSATIPPRVKRAVAGRLEVDHEQHERQRNEAQSGPVGVERAERIEGQQETDDTDDAADVSARAGEFEDNRALSPMVNSSLAIAGFIIWLSSPSMALRGTSSTCAPLNCKMTSLPSRTGSPAHPAEPAAGRARRWR